MLWLQRQGCDPFGHRGWQGWAHRDLNPWEYFGSTQNTNGEPDFKNSIFFTTVNTETPDQDTGIAMKQVKVKQFQAGLGNNSSKPFSNI